MEQQASKNEELAQMGGGETEDGQAHLVAKGDGSVQGPPKQGQDESAPGKKGAGSSHLSSLLSEHSCPKDT